MYGALEGTKHGNEFFHKYPFINEDLREENGNDDSEIYCEDVDVLTMADRAAGRGADSVAETIENVRSQILAAREYLDRFNCAANADECVQLYIEMRRKNVEPSYYIMRKWMRFCETPSDIKALIDARLQHKMAGSEYVEKTLTDRALRVQTGEGFRGYCKLLGNYKIGLPDRVYLRVKALVESAKGPAGMRVGLDVLKDAKLTDVGCVKDKFIDLIKKTPRAGHIEAIFKTMMEYGISADDKMITALENLSLDPNGYWMIFFFLRGRFAKELLPTDEWKRVYDLYANKVLIYRRSASGAMKIFGNMLENDIRPSYRTMEALEKIQLDTIGWTILYKSVQKILKDHPDGQGDWEGVIAFAREKSEYRSS
ncbi:MAG: hypothetical protein ABH856_04055 [Patescibacteria group bacterium]|nr:hypothetical protein [Patescibacteria group bacterium]